MKNKIKLFLVTFFLFCNVFANERILKSFDVIYKKSDRQIYFGTATQTMSERNTIGGPFDTYRWTIQPVSIINCTDLKIKNPQLKETENEKKVWISPIECTHIIEKHHYKSPTEIGYLIDHKYKGTLNDGSKTDFWIFYSGFRTQFTPTRDQNDLKSKAVELSFQ